MGVFDVLLNALDVDAAIVTDPADMTYLSGYDNADCVIVVTRDRAVYFTDALTLKKRYFELCGDAK